MHFGSSSPQPSAARSLGIRPRPGTPASAPARRAAPGPRSGPPVQHLTGPSAAKPSPLLRPVVTACVADHMRANASNRAQAIHRLRTAVMTKALRGVGLEFPHAVYPVSRASTEGPEFLLHHPMKRVLSEFVRRTKMPLAQFVELVRCQTLEDYRPNKHLVPAVLANVSLISRSFKQLPQRVSKFSFENLRRCNRSAPKTMALLAHGSTSYARTSEQSRMPCGALFSTRTFVDMARGILQSIWRRGQVWW